MRGPQTLKINLARRLRRESTDAAMELWQKLRARQIDGYKFVRQEPVGSYIADFVSRDARLIIELDGGQHADSTRDAIRDRWFAEHGYRVMRFWNNDVLQNIEGVLQTIASGLVVTPHHPDR